MGRFNYPRTQTVGEKVNCQERNSSDRRLRFPTVSKYKAGLFRGGQMESSEGLAAATKTMFT